MVEVIGGNVIYYTAAIRAEAWAKVGGYSDDDSPAKRAGVAPIPLIQPTNAGDAGRRPRAALPVATMDRKLSQVVCS